MRIVTPHHCILSLMSPNLLPSPWDLLDFAQPFGGSCFSTPKSFTALMLSILKQEGWQARIPLGFPGMQWSCGGGMEMETHLLCCDCASPTPWYGDCGSAHPDPGGCHADLGDITLTRGCLACPTVLLTDMEVGMQDPLGLGKLGAQAEKDRRLRKK